MKKLGTALARHTGQEEGEAISHLLGRLGVLLQRSNAPTLANRVPAPRRAMIDSILLKCMISTIPVEVYYAMHYI